MTTFGDITNPLDKVGSGGYQGVGTGLPSFLSNVLKLAFVVAGLFALFNFIFAGFVYLTAAGDKEKIEKATRSINISLLGLVLMVGAGILTGIISFLLFKDPSAILKPNLVGPGSYTP